MRRERKFTGEPETIHGRTGMYKSFFGLRENPFRVNPDPRYLYLTPRTQKALDQLTCGVQHCKGLILLTGEVGTGKTTLIHYLLNWLREQNTPTAFIFNSHLTVNHLFDFILADFGVPIDFRLNGNMLMALNLWLRERFRLGERPVLIVDEAQGLSIGALEEIRLLLNLETDTEKLLQIVLVGQPELEELLKRPELRELRQRIELRCSTAPLEPEESHRYIAERLRIAGANGEIIFPSETMDAVYSYSKGIPRVINLLCEHALINAYAEQARRVPVCAVEEAAQDFQLDGVRKPPRPPSDTDSSSGNQPVMQATLEKNLVRSPAMVGASLHDRARSIWSSAPAAFAKEEFAAAEVKGLFTPIWGLADSEQEGTGDSRLSSPRAFVCRYENESIGAAKKNPVLAPRKSRTKGKAWNTIPRASGGVRIRSLVFALELRRRASAAAQRNHLSVYLTQMVRRCVVDFRRDWNAMMNGVEFSLSAKSLLQWLRQPAASKRQDPSS